MVETFRFLLRVIDGFMSKSMMVAKRRDRCIATILSFKEAEIDDLLQDPELSSDFRKLILDSVNDVCNLAIDLIDDASIVNEIFLDRLDEMLNG